MKHIVGIQHGDEVVFEISGPTTFSIAVNAKPVAPVDTEPQWALPVNTHTVAWTTMRGNRHNLKSHTGYDINANVYPFGDVEVKIGATVHAIAPALVYYVNHEVQSWTAGGIVVLMTPYNGNRLYTRYAHVAPVVQEGEIVKPGDVIAGFVAHPAGSHLHFDMAMSPIRTEWLSSTIEWPDPAEILVAQIGQPAREFFYT